MADPPGYTAFAAAIRQQESGSAQGNYTEANGDGAYQIIPSTWRSNAAAAGYPEYADAPASAAPPAVQDAVAKQMMLGYYYGAAGQQWREVAKAWNGGPGCIGRPCANSVLGPGMTGVDNYADAVMAKMAALPGGGAQNRALAGPGIFGATAAAEANQPGLVDCYIHSPSFGILGGGFCMDGVLFSGLVVVGAVTLLAGSALLLVAIGSKAPAAHQAVSTIRRLTPVGAIPRKPAPKADESEKEAA